MMVVTKDSCIPIRIILKDCFENIVTINETDVQTEIRKDSESGVKVHHELMVYTSYSGSYELSIKIDREGYYVGCVKYQATTVVLPKFTFICLSAKDMQIVDCNVEKKSLNVKYKGKVLETAKKVHCYISPRQLQVKKYYTIMKRMFTCRVSTATKIIFHPEPGQFTLDDGRQEPLTLVSPYREILAATFHKFVLKNIGGSENFQEKRSFFYEKLQEHHSKNSRIRQNICISRIDFLNNVLKATKRFSSSDWCKQFFVVFSDEEAWDCGGVSREFFELLCVNLFDDSNKFFVRFNKDNSQGLVHPNNASNRPSSHRHRLDYYEFAGKIVGKCLYESCHGNTQLVKARFTRSFLAQLIGLRIDCKYFESDDPDLYTTKVKYILENDVTDSELVFAEEEFHPGQSGPTSEGGLVQEMKLIGDLRAEDTNDSTHHQQKRSAAL